MFQQARKKIHEIKSEDGQVKLENNLRASLAKQLQDLSVTFRKYQKDFLHSKKKKIFLKNRFITVFFFLIEMQARQQKKHEYSLDIDEGGDDENFQIEMVNDFFFKKRIFWLTNFFFSLLHQFKKRFYQIMKKPLLKGKKKLNKLQNLSKNWLKFLMIWQH